MFDIFKPIEWLADFIVYNLMHLTAKTNLATSLHFFIYDTIKIFILLLAISFVVGFIKSFFTPENTRKYLTGKHTGVGNILAAMLGIVTPFCSCSACPLFIGFVEAGIPLGVTFSYLIAAPMINEVAVILLWGLFGIKVTGIYILSGLIIAVFGGMIIGLFNLERYIEPFVFQTKVKSCCASGNNVTFKDRIQEAKESAWSIFKKTWPYIVAGVGIGAFIHGYVPTGLLVKYAGINNPFAVPLAVLLGVPLYANVAGVLPITEVLVKQGLPIGTVLAFTMAVTAISLPEMLILKRVLKLPLLGIFIAILTSAIIFTGYLFNFIL
ncbi:MAG: permease [Candidatus Gastranaerophilales bacterium]|nr:permease [Candidatus Gastranaerophilales bacterium]